MNSVKLIVHIAGHAPMIYTFNTADAAKVADRYIQRQWNNEYVSSKIVYGDE